MKNYALTVIATAIIGIFLVSMIGKKILTSPYSISAQEHALFLSSSQSSFSLLELHMALMENNPNILFIDLRSEDEYNIGHIKNAINIPLDMLFHSDYSEYIDGRGDITKVLYANSEELAVKALALLTLNGHSNYKTLSGGYFIASSFIIDEPNPSYFHFTDEQKKFNYGQLMPSGRSTNTQNTQQEIKVDTNVPRGGC